MKDHARKFIIKDAERSFGKIVAAFKGMSGSGKTYSALIFARGLVGPSGKITLIDTEGRRALMYADDAEIGKFKHIEFDAPYSSEGFADAIKQASADGADAIIIDSASHEHEAEGGMLWFADQEDERLRKADKYGNDPGMRKWIKPKMEHNRFMRTAVSCKSNIIFCVRQTRTTEMQEIEENGRKKKKAIEIISDVCEKNFEFDMDIVIELERETHKAKFVKVPKPYLAAIKNGDILTVGHGNKFAEVLSAPTKGTRAAQGGNPPKTEETSVGGNQLFNDFQIILGRGDPLNFSDPIALHDWIKNNIPKVKTLDALKGFEDRNSENFKRYAEINETASEWMGQVNEIINDQRKALKNGDDTNKA